ncbi:MAG: hypothetical protein ISN29_09395, partial [Gammaproteobacteria bacterium AqS3]|nr:hypothetical protein [Gammaproteobacteria bacterium AqS3]
MTRMKASLNPAPSAAPPQPLLTSPARAAAALLLLLALGLSMQAQGQSLEIRVVKKPDEAAAPTFLALNEGETREIEVRLSFAPNQVRHLEAHPPAGVIAREPGTRFGTLYYEPNQGRTWKTLRITAIQDDDHRHVDGTITFMYWCCGGVSNSTASGSIRVTVQDDDLPDVVVTPRPVVVDEGTSSTFSVTLSKQPHSAVRLALTSDGIAFSPSTVTLTPSDWNVPHAVTITAAEDADKENEVGTVNISHVNVNDRPVTVTIVDNDATPVGVTLSAPEVVVTEGGSNTFTVRLAAAPNGRKIVRLASDNPDVTLSPASLTFTASNWSAAQTVTASAAEDGRAEDETALITLSGIGIASGSTLVRVRDNDFAGHLSIAPSVITITEGDKITASSQLAQALTVSVDHEPTLDNLSLLLGDPAGSAALRVGTGDAGIAMQYRRGSTGTAAGGTPVPLSATDFIEALEDDNTVDETYTIPITVRATNGDYGGFEGATADITVHVLDNDPVVLRLSAASLVMEEGGSGDFTVRMRNRPGASHTVTLASNNPDVMVSPASLTFTTTNWSAAQTVTVSAARDADATEDVAHINFDSANDDVSATPVAVRVREIVEMTLTPAALRLAEGGTATFTVQLAGRPHSDTTLSLASDNADVTIDTDPAAAGDQATLRFTSANWSAARTVTLSAAEDADTAGDSATVSITGAAVVDSALAVTVDENDVIPLTLSAGELTIGEGQSQSFTVQLESRPNSLRGVSLVSDSADVTLSTASLAFTTTNWNVAQTVTVSAEDDADSADERARISLTGDGIESASVSVTAVDDDIGFTLSAASLRLDEGASGSLDVRLDAQPSGSRTVTLVSDNDAVTLNPASLDFTTANWSTAQPVTVTALEDADFDDDSAQISLSSPNVADAEATVTVTDNDIVGLMLSTGQLTLHENQSGSFTARLQSRPNSVRAISIASDNTDVTLSTVSLAFTRDNWDTPQRVTASVRADADKADETAHISLAGAGVLAASVSMQVIDDGIGYALSASSLRLDEGASGSFHVRLDAQPDYDRSVTLSSSNADVEVSPTTLEFTPANWSIGHHVTVSAAQDDDADADTARISLASDGTVTRNVGVVVVEDDVLGIQVTGAPLALDEGASGSLMVRLSAAPLRATTVALASDYAGVTLEPASLSFTASNWGAPQTVTVSAREDADSGDETAEVTLTASGLDTVRAAVSVEDDETLGI